MPEDAAAKPASQLILVSTSEGDASIVRCSGKLIAGSVGLLQNQVRELLTRSPRVVLDLTDLGYMDSTGLGSIIGLYVSAKGHGKRLELVNLTPRVRQLLSITNVLTLFETCGEQNVRIP